MPGNLVVESKWSKGWLNGNGDGSLLGPSVYEERTSDFIRVTAGTIYTFQWWSTIATGKKCWEAWQFYDTNKQPFGGRGGYSEYGSDGAQHGKRTVTAPPNACYIRLSFRGFGGGHMMFEPGVGSASYMPSFDDSLKSGVYNLLRSSKGPFQPKNSRLDNYAIYQNSWIDMEKGKKYIISAKGTAPFSSTHATVKEENKICLWLVKHDENINVDRIISSSTTGTDGTTFTWNNSPGRYRLRVNTYKIDNSNYAENVLIEEGDVKNNYVRNPEDYGWSKDPLVPTQSQRYLWKFEYVYYSDGSVEVTDPVNASIAGQNGATGLQGPKGDKGADGIAGKDGVGLKSTVVTYGLSASETTPPTNWTTQVPTLTKGKYLWTKTVWTYTDNTSETGYQKTYIAKDGNDGADGIAGKDGVGIKTTTITYAGSTSGTTKPTSGWTSTIPSVPAGQYLWTKTVWTYTDDTSETGYSVAKMGEKGQDGQNSYMHTAYANITKLCDESLNFTIKTSSIVRYGYADKWVYKTFEAGTYAATNATFGRDPYSGKTKRCELIADFSLTDSTGRGWLGTYSDNNLNAVSDPSRYIWQLTKGPQGPQGIQGLQGPKGDQGIQGPKGADGRTQYTHIGYADNETGGGFSQTDQTKAYIGMYVDFTATDSTDPTKYRWSKWHGDKGATGAQGIQGPKGADGRTPYLHIAYANSADGRTDFSTSNSDNKRYLGTYTDYTQADSTDPTKYTWMDRRAGVKVGGKNLLLHTADPWKAPNDYYQFIGVTKTDEMLNGSVVYKTRSIWSRLAMNWGKQLIDRPDVKIGDEFTYSVYVRTDQETPIKARLFFRYRGQSDAEDMAGEKLITQEWQRFTKTFTVTQKMLSDSSKLSWVGFEQTANSEDGKFVYYACNMLEEGNVPTPWTQALEDIQSDIDSKADQTLTQEQLNALEAKRLQMETEMKALATLQQVSELETFINNLKKEDLDGRQKIIEITKAIEERVKDIEPIMEYSQKLKFMDTYITQGNGGMIIGANDSTTKVVVTPDRISFQSGGSEVAYISQRMLHIDNGVFTMSLQLGHYITRAHPKNEYVNATYFVK